MSSPCAPAACDIDPGAACDSPEVVTADWVFAYGSLIWNPGFDFMQAHLARLHGWHRSFCIASTRYRGTPEAPGIVLGLDHGGSCVGMAFRLRPQTRLQALRAVFEREMGGKVYQARIVTVTLEDHRKERALAFIANHASLAYARLAEPEILRRLSHCRGERGPNRDYAIETWRALDAQGVHCPHLTRLMAQLSPPTVDCQALEPEHPLT
jgi:cation transport protein ChaC